MPEQRQNLTRAAMIAHFAQPSPNLLAQCPGVLVLIL